MFLFLFLFFASTRTLTTVNLQVFSFSFVPPPSCAPLKCHNLQRQKRQHGHAIHSKATNNRKQTTESETKREYVQQQPQQQQQQQQIDKLHELNDFNQLDDFDQLDESDDTSTNIISFHPGDYKTEPIIDQEGRQWRSPEDLGRLRRDGLKKPQESYMAVHDDDRHNHNLDQPMDNQTENLMVDIAYLEPPQPYEATMKQHSMMLRDMEKGNTQNMKKGRFVTDEERWLHKYDALVRFHERYGHTYVPTLARTIPYNRIKVNSYIETDQMLITNEDTDYYQNAGNLNEEESLTLYVDDEFMEPYSRMQLGHWVTQQRHYYKFYNGTRMTLQRIEYLNALDFIWDIKEARWQEQYYELKEFKNRFGHTLVRQNTTLGHWIYKQRWYQRCINTQKMIDLANVPNSAFNKDNHTSDGTNTTHTISHLPNGGRMYNGKVISPLTPDHRALLNDIGFIWDHWDYIWETSHAELVEFKKRYGHTRVPPTKYPSLSDWVRKHRAKWRRMHGNKDNNKDTNERDDDIMNCKESEVNDVLVNGGDTIHGIESDNSIILRPDRIQKLDSIGFEWVVRKYTWDDHYNHLLDYNSIYGHVNVPQNFNDPDRHPNLGPWLSTQRVTWRKDRKLMMEEQKQGKRQPKANMPKDRIDRLEAVGIVWEPALAKFKQQVKDSLNYQVTGKVMPKSVKKWIKSTKEEYTKHLAGELTDLDEDRINILDDAKFL